MQSDKNHMIPKIKEAMSSAKNKGLRVETINMGMGFRIHLPDGTVKRVPSATQLIQFVEKYKSK